MWTLTGFADEISDDFAEQLALLNSLGVRFLEFRSAWQTKVLDLTPEQLEAAKRMLDEAGIGVSSIGSDLGKIQITEPFEAHLERARHAVDIAGFFGARYIRIFSFFIADGDDPAVHRDEVLRRTRAMVDLAEAAGVTMLHENEKDIYGDVPSRVVDLITSVDSPRYRAIFDPANYVQCHVRPFDEAYPLVRPFIDYIHCKDAKAGSLKDGIEEVVLEAAGLRVLAVDVVGERAHQRVGHVRPFDEAYPLVRPFTDYIHCKDAKAGSLKDGIEEVVPCGEGDGQVREVVAALRESGFDGFFSLEPHLGRVDAFGALSGPDLWTTAHRALTGVFEEQGIAWQ